MKARVLVNHPGGLFKVGEEGYVLENDSSKYDFFIKLPGEMSFGPFGNAPRCFYFYDAEVELIKEEQV